MNKGNIVIRKLLPILVYVVTTGGICFAATVGPNQNAPAATNQANGEYFCPPGAKYCPVPGRDNTVYLDTHFGMDAATGEIKAYKGTVHPDEVVNNLTTQEEQLYVSPPINVANRYVPYPGSQDNAGSPALYPAPASQPQPVYQNTYLAAANSNYGSPAPVYSAPIQPQPYQAAPQLAAAAPIRKSEVANQQSSRSRESAQPLANDNKIPWWKGGLWRNRKNRDSSQDASSNSSASASPASDAPAPISPDDMWGDEDEYSGYNDDGSFSNRSVAAAPAAASSDPYADPYSDPYAQPQFSPAPASAQASSGVGGPVYASEPYTLPDSPPPSSPYHEGYVYPRSDVTYENTFQVGYPSQQQQPSVYQPGDPYASPAMNAVPVNAQPSSQSGFSMSPPPASPAPSPAAQFGGSASSGGSPQFEQAVSMVKESRFAEAKPLLLSETASDPNNASVWRWLGDAQYNLLELQDAINSYANALRIDPNDYYAVRGQGFAYLHRGHELWRKMMEELKLGQRDQAAATFSEAHDNYKKSLEKLSECLRRAPNDDEAIYGEAMAAEGASRKLYSNAISYIKLGPENRNRAELFAENCIQVINKGVERASTRARENPGESGPRALLGGLYLRKAMLYHHLGKNDLALAELRNSYGVQKSIIDEIDKNNATALKGVQDCETYWAEWGGTGNL